jgi:hypothetical protein
MVSALAAEIIESKKREVRKNVFCIWFFFISVYLSASSVHSVQVFGYTENTEDSQSFTEVDVFILQQAV